MTPATVALGIAPADNGRHQVTLHDAQGTLVDSLLVDTRSDIARDRVAKTLLVRFPALNVETVRRQLLEAESQRQAREAAASTAPPSTEASLLERYDELVESQLAKTDPGIRAEADALLADPQLLARVCTDLGAVGLAGEQDLAVTLYVLGTSRLLLPPARPLAAIVQGSSSSGKSHAIACVASLFPDEGVIATTDMTPRALYYLPDGGLMHRWIVAGERSRVQDDATAEKTRALRELLSSGRLSVAIPEKIGERIETVRRESPGPVAFVESTTLTRLFEEDANRCLLLGTDETPAQTRRVLDRIAAAYTGATFGEPGRRRLVHQTAQRMLQRLRVRIPYADALIERMPDSRAEARRAAGWALATVAAVALVHQRQRATSILQHGDSIDATLDDYRIARLLLGRPLARALGGGLPDHVQRFFEWLVSAAPGREVSRKSVVELAGCPVATRQAHDLLRALTEADLIELVAEAAGPRPALYRVPAGLPAAGSSWLPSPEDLPHA